MLVGDHLRGIVGVVSAELLFERVLGFVEAGAIKAGAAAPRYDVDNTVWLGVLDAVKLRVEGEGSVNLFFLRLLLRLQQRRGIGEKLERTRALVIVDVPRERHAHSLRLKQRT